MSNLLTLLSVFTGTPIPDLEIAYQGKGYGDLKGDLADAFAAFVPSAPAQVGDYLADPAELDRVLAGGADPGERGRRATVTAVYDRVGFLTR